MIVNSEEIARLRLQLIEYPDALIALAAIDDCEGDLEDAAINLAIRASQEPGLNNSDWLPALAKRCRAALCQQNLRVDLINGNWATALHFLQANKICPNILAVPVLLYVDNIGIDRFCEPIDAAPQSFLQN
jgi:hypothetical protein